jgi:hypothetical protein
MGNRAAMNASHGLIRLDKFLYYIHSTLHRTLQARVISENNNSHLSSSIYLVKVKCALNVSKVPHSQVVVHLNTLKPPKFTNSIFSDVVTLVHGSLDDAESKHHHVRARER